MRSLVGFSVVSLCAGLAAAPADASTVASTLFSSGTPGVVGSPPVVPVGICSVTITAEGGQGGTHDGFMDVPGGAGAAVSARVGVTPGAVLHVLVGGVGGTGGGDDGLLFGDGGIGGGGGGGNGAAGGGGASVVWTDDLVPLVVAGAGGGSKHDAAGGAGGLLGQPGGDGGTNSPSGTGPAGGKGGQADGTGGAGGGDGLDWGGGGGGGVGTGGAGGDLVYPNRDGGAGGTGNGTVGGAGGGGGGAPAGGGTSSGAGVAGGAPPGAGSGGTGGFVGDGGTGVAPGGDAGAAHAIAGGGGGGGVGFGGGGGAGTGSNGKAAGGGAGYGAGGGAAGEPGGGGGGGSSFVTPSALSSSSAASTRTGDGQVTITYDPTVDACPGQFDFQKATSTKVESGTDVRVRVARTGDLTGPATVDFATTDDTALAGVDYEAAAGTLTWPDGVGGTRTITVTLLDDALDERAESLTLTLSNPTGGVLGTLSQSTVKVSDDDDPPAVAFTTPSRVVYEGTGTDRTPTFTVELDAPSGMKVTVPFHVVFGTADAADLASALPSQLVFKPGVTSRSITVTVLGDATFELDESLDLQLDAPTNATLGSQNTVTLIIRNDD